MVVIDVMDFESNCILLRPGKWRTVTLLIPISLATCNRCRKLPPLQRPALCSQRNPASPCSRLVSARSRRLHGCPEVSTIFPLPGCGNERPGDSRVVAERPPWRQFPIDKDNADVPWFSNQGLVKWMLLVDRHKNARCP